MVAMNVWPTDAADGSVATEARWRKMARLWAPSGVAEGVGGNMAPSLVYPNLTIRSGAAWVDGAYCELTGDQVLAVTANGLVVVRFDPAANTAQLLYRDAISVPAQDPAGTWELPIAQIVGSALVDKRSNLLAPAFPRVIYRQINAVSQESGDIGKTTLVHTSTGAAGAGAPTFIQGHDYDIRAYLPVHSLTGTGSTGFLVQIMVAGAAVQGAEVYIPSNNLNIKGDLTTIYHHAAATGPQKVDATMEQAWWGANPVRFASGPGLPRSLIIIDLGPVPAIT